MYNSAKEVMEQILNNISLLKTEDIPNIDLYMDQVTTYLNEKLEHLKRYSDDKLLTKTMINNYAKDGLLPPPEKKKYSKDHIIMLIMIYYFKNILSINDVAKVINPIKSRYFHTEDNFSLAKMYDTVANFEGEKLDALADDINKIYENCSNSHLDIDDENERDFLQFFKLISMLSYDVFVKTAIIEALIDQIPEEKEPEEKPGKKAKTSDEKEKNKDHGKKQV